MMWSVVLGIWPFLSSALALTGGLSVGVEANRGAVMTQATLFRWQGVEGSPLRLNRLDLIGGGRWGWVEGGGGVGIIRLDMLGGKVQDVVPVLYAGLRNQGPWFGRIGARIGFLPSPLWSVGMEMGVGIP